MSARKAHTVLSLSLIHIFVARAQAVRPAPIKAQMAEAAKQAGKENAARPAPAKAKEARNDR